MRGRPGLCPGPLLENVQHSPRPLSRLRALLLKIREGGREGKEGGEEGREDEVKWNPHFLGESYAPGHQEGHRIPIDLILNRFL